MSRDLALSRDLLSPSQPEVEMADNQVGMEEAMYSVGLLYKHIMMMMMMMIIIIIIIIVISIIIIIIIIIITNEFLCIIF